jgi:outer membrane murein-binding lipoprotein Lpp
VRGFGFRRRMAEPIFHVPIVQQDLRQDETIVQIVDSLKFLQSCATCVFAKVDARLDESAKKLQSVQARIAKCKQKVDKLASSKKAAKVRLILAIWSWKGCKLTNFM